MRIRVGILAVTFASCVHPGYHVGVVARLFRHGQYVEAIQRATMIEQDLASLTPEKQAHYGIYRGASHLALHELRLARVWLDYAAQLRATYPALIVGEHAAILDQSLAELARQEAAAGGAGPGTAQPPAPATTEPPIVSMAAPLRQRS